ncbi:glycosyltransferase family 2 protein [Mumia sp. zg.B53]|uniref:glycosyltransferase family 2 protein n=1 Tax=unclassified Mumia TaxID=2621872 RepID=UPI001C6F5BCC|nr:MULTISPECIES: glycosyltransferase family 2 protein [unclassified Mumia]MBW9205434.1 glycosyltransferase family 2 protein [Mumia sp. zg.B17]MBW9208564.1 glycosyltransferase family 2 protein [Mumia sp. zg.B21]MBW9216523.1 glycosyltransferase family 2 protein [Mumia sp. zg.B53]MDD9347154.1 glycosyltransferase family 2 protein [Mumia sp.]
MTDARVCDLVVPCRDEARALPEALAHVPERFSVIVVDNGSRDGTAEVARELGARVVHEAVAGYGAAVDAGVRASRAPYVAVMDGDGSMDAADLDPLLDAVLAGRATMALGRRRPVSSGVWPWHARAGTTLLAAWIRRSTGLALHDLAPMRVCPREDLVALDLRDRRFGYPLELMLGAARAGWTVEEHDIAYRARAAGTRSKVSGSVRGTVRTALDFAKVMR